MNTDQFPNEKPSTSYSNFQVSRGRAETKPRRRGLFTFRGATTLAILLNQFSVGATTKETLKNTGDVSLFLNLNTGEKVLLGGGRLSGPDRL